MDLRSMATIPKQHEESFLSSRFSTSVMDRVEILLNDIIDHPLYVDEHKTNDLCSLYLSFNEEEKLSFLTSLSIGYSIDHADILEHAEAAYNRQIDEQQIYIHERKLMSALVPKYLHVFKAIARLEGGVKFIVGLRADVLDAIEKTRGWSLQKYFLQRLSDSLKDLLSMWFFVGLLHVQRVTWQSSCDILQKISEYESVHPISDWSDLKRRVGPYRRCYAFMHSSMPSEPLVVLHTALTPYISSKIHTILLCTGNKSKPNEVEDKGIINSAVFYSITSTQKGLQGIELGNYLIKCTVRELIKEFPHLQQFSSLSPIPGFRTWLIGEINSSISKLERSAYPLRLHELQNLSKLFNVKQDRIVVLTSLKQTLISCAWVNYPALCDTLKVILTRLCAHYLCNVKRRGYVMNYVANFHLSNGAVLWRINWLADTSPRGLKNSCGLMVNYRYYLGNTDAKSRRYRQTFHVEASEEVLQLLQSDCLGKSKL